MNQRLIVIDGKTYNNVDEMPEDVRRNYENAMRQSGNRSNNDSNSYDFLEALADNIGEMPNAFEGTTANVFSSSRIVINGRVYNSIDELPPDVRAEYEQAMSAAKDSYQNNNMPMTNVMSNGMKFIVNGQTFNNPNDLPPEARAKYEQAMGALDANKNGIPDFVEGMFGVSNQTNTAATSFGTTNPPPASRKPTPVTTTIEPESSGGWMLALAGILLIGLCGVAAAVGIWYFVIR